MIEDDPAISRGLLDALTREGYAVQSACEGKRGLEMAIRENVDLVILDVMLPGMDGHEICRRLRAEGSGIPILILSARSREADKVVGLELGADDYITKPFGVAELLARVKAVLRRTQPKSGETKLKCYSFSNIQLDFESFRASRGGKDLELTAREFALLAHFIRNRGKVISRDDLLTAVWGHDTPPETRTVDTHIAQLRKKIERKPAHPKYLVSIRRAGYRFEG